MYKSDTSFLYRFLCPEFYIFDMSLNNGLSRQWQIDKRHRWQVYISYSKIWTTQHMGHSITAIILKGDFDKDKATHFDLRPISLDFGLILFHIDHYYSACWQHKLKTSGQLDLSTIDCITFPREIAISEIIKTISSLERPEYAIILTDYFGGTGNQYANVFINSDNADRNVTTINQALRHLGVPAKNGKDEFDTIGLDKIRSQPDYLETYVDLADDYGV